MSIGKNVSLCFFAAVAGAGAVYVHCPDFVRSTVPAKWHRALHFPIATYTGNTTSPDDWKDTAALESKLLGLIDQRLTGTDPDQVRRFIKNPENRLILAQHAIARADRLAADKRTADKESFEKTLKNLRDQIEEGAPAGSGLPVSPKIAARNKKLEQRIAAIEAELSAPHSIGDIAATEAGAHFLNQVASNLDWVNQFGSTGEPADPGAALSIIGKIIQHEPDIIYNKLERDTATATALEFSRSGWIQSDAVNRALYFIRNHRTGRLNRVFDSLPMWQRRVVCGLKGRGTALGAGGNDKAGSVASMEYSLDNVHLPAYRYTGSCWQAPYRTYNIYGESIHGPHYHETFYDLYGDNFNELTRTVGGVCGGLSHYGATTATANGVPAMTSGEPGHCSYVVLVGDVWTPAYSLSWQRGMHWQVFQGNNKFSALEMATRLFSPEEKEKTELSYAMNRLGNAYADSDPQKAKNLLRNAVLAQPNNYYAWRDYAAFLAKSAPDDAAAWSSLCSDVHTLMAPTHAEMAAELLKGHVYPGLKKAMAANPDELRDLVLSFWDSVQNMGPTPEWDKGFHARWDVEGLAQAQLNILGINPSKNPAVQDFFRTLMTKVSGKEDYAPVALSWGNSLLEKMDKSLQSDFMAAMLGGMSAGTGSATDEQREKMLKPVILAAEKSEDIRSFQAIGKSLPAKYHSPEGNNRLPKIDPMPDQLVSQGGIIQTSSTSNFENPCNHWGILEPGVGGAFHTAKDTDAWVKVVLPKQANVTGVIIQTTTGNLWRLNNMVIQVSENGSDWKDVANIDKCDRQTLRVDLKDSAPLAKYVRIMRKGGPEFFHLRAIYVYGKPAA